MEQQLAKAIDTVSKMYNIPIIGIIEPTVNYILKQKNIKNIGVIATAGTIRSNGWEKALKEKNSELNIIKRRVLFLHQWQKRDGPIMK